MHICHVITRLIIGGAQENTVLSCEGLHELGHRITLISGPTTGPEGSLLPRVRAGGYRLIELPELIRAVNPWYDARALRELRRLFETLRPDVVHTHSSKAGILGRFAAFDAGVPHIVHTIHGMSFNRTQHPLTRALYVQLERAAARRCHALLSVADALGAQALAARICRPEKLLTIYSGMETHRFDPADYDRAAVRREWPFPPDAIIVATVARLFRRKGYEQLIPIMARAAAADPRLHFLWIGDGAQRGEYEAELQRIGLRARTHLVGLVPPAEIPRLLAGCDLLAHTSQWEGLPRAVVQGLLMNLPAVAFDIDGTPEVLRDGVTGRLLPLNDLAGFAAALLELAGDERLRARLGQAGRGLCLARFDWREMVAQLDALYARLARSEGVAVPPAGR